jgi:uncharacterized protein
MPGQFGLVAPILLLIVSNTFMTFAWYGHLKFPHSALWVAVLVSWAVALIEYCFAIPANRIGSQYYSLAELKTIQEVVTLAVFVIVTVLFFGEKITLIHGLGFALIAAGAALVFNAR